MSYIKYQIIFEIYVSLLCRETHRKSEGVEIDKLDLNYWIHCLARARH